jgi:hypothetical protein
MPHTDIADDIESRSQTASRSGVSRLQQLVGDLRECAYNDHRLLIPPAFGNFNQPPDRCGVFHGRTSKLHHHQIVALLEPALPFAHCATPFPKYSPQRKTHRQIASGGGFG